jgi:hypothetical protein
MFRAIYGCGNTGGFREKSGKEGDVNNKNREIRKLTDLEH